MGDEQRGRSCCDETRSCLPSQDFEPLFTFPLSPELGCGLELGTGRTQKQFSVPLQAFGQEEAFSVH